MWSFILSRRKYFFYKIHNTNEKKRRIFSKFTNLLHSFVCWWWSACLQFSSVFVRKILSWCLFICLFGKWEENEQCVDICDAVKQPWTLSFHSIPLISAMKLVRVHFWLFINNISAFVRFKSSSFFCVYILGRAKVAFY